jgi:hypothetical protein
MRYASRMALEPWVFHCFVGGGDEESERGSLDLTYRATSRRLGLRGNWVARVRYVFD